MNTETLRQLFKEPFDYESYSNEIVHRLFGCNDVATHPELLDINADGDQCFFIGQMDDVDHRLLGFFYTRMTDGSDVRRKRVLSPIEHQPTPYELYMRMLIDHFGTQVEDDFVPQLPEGYDDLTYQRDAVVQGYDIMMRHGGCFIADVVGLGKTVIAAIIAQRFIAANGDNTRILVIFPPAVHSNWEDTFRDFTMRQMPPTS